MSSAELSKGIYWVGAIDWDLRFCGSYTTPRGTTYNAYIIVDDKIALIDTVEHGFTGEMLSRIRDIVDPSKIDYIISQHSEQDHAGALPEIVKIAKNAKVITSQAGKRILSAIYGTDFNAQAVKTGDTLSLGKKTLAFVEAQMLHWPDNFFTYVKEDSLLFSNDAFGQHIATDKRFYDEVGEIAMEEASKYFAVIVSMYSNFVQKKIKEVEAMNLPINMIAPAHGLIWRDPSLIINAYKKWSSSEAGKKITVLYDTMWHSTEQMAHEISRGISEENVSVHMFNLRRSDLGAVTMHILESSLIAIGSPTLNNGMYPSVGGFLTFIKGLKLQNKKAAAFGSYGWGRGAVKAITEELNKMDIEVVDKLEIQYVPRSEDLQACFELGQKLAKLI